MSIFVKHLGYIPRFKLEKSSKCFEAIEYNGNPAVNIYLRNLNRWKYDDFLFSIMQAEHPYIEQGVFDCNYELERITRKRFMSKIATLIVLLFYGYVFQFSESCYADAVNFFIVIYGFYSAYYLSRQESLYQAKKRLLSIHGYVNK